MQIQPHDLRTEFPEYKERIQRLKLTDTRFTKLAEEYDHLDQEIRRIELEGSLIADVEIEEMKMHRVHLKDKLYAYLKAA